MTLEELQGKILDVLMQREALVNTLEPTVIADAEAAHSYEMKWAREYLSASVTGEKKTVDHTKALVTVACEMESLTTKLAHAKLVALKGKLATMDSEISALQSLLSAHKAEAQAIQFGKYSGA